MEETIRRIEALGREIQMPEPALVRMRQVFAKSPQLAAYEDGSLHDSAVAQAANDRLIQQLAGDTDGMQKLGIYLLAADRAWEKVYRPDGADRQMYLDTVGMLSRFVRECRQMYGKICFDRSTWVWRIMCGRIYRIGSLEFERKTMETAVPQAELAAGTPVLSVHIPSDADLSEVSLQQTYARARSFFARLEPDMPLRPLVCDSWMLAPGLRDLLPPDSGILRFAQDYVLYGENPEDTSPYRWVFHSPDGKLDHFPTQTTLQKNLLAYYRSGRNLGSAAGIFRH